MEKYNLDKLVKVEVNDFYLSRSYVFKKERKIFGIIIREKGFYQCWTEKFIGMIAPINYIIKDNELYEKPEVILHYQEGFYKKYYFESYDEAKKYVNNLIPDFTNGRKWN
jgi:hypothetical protein